jgi:hypothetical protein
VLHRPAADQVHIVRVIHGAREFLLSFGNNHRISR